ncbi:hypothetical protein HpCK6_07960 [Helicobacter pylori]
MFGKKVKKELKEKPVKRSGLNPLKRGFKKGFNALVSKHIVEIHAIKPSVLQGSA